MKNTSIMFAISMLLLVGSWSGMANAASSGTGGDSDLSWTCRSLAVGYAPGWRVSGCYANSPDASLHYMYISSSISGQAVWNAGNSFDYPSCSTPSYGSPYSDNNDDDYTTYFGKTETLYVEWQMNIKDFSFNDMVSGYGEWSLLSWSPPQLPGGQGSVGPYWNVSGTCW